MKQLALGVRLRAHAVFASFATGQNSEVVAALEGSGRDPLWLWGSQGCGKTHLLQAVCAQAGEGSAYFPLDRTARLPPEALGGYARCRVLCIDDAQAVAGDLDWERSLERLIISAPLRARLGANGHAHVTRRYSLRAYQTQYLALLARLAAA